MLPNTKVTRYPTKDKSAVTDGKIKKMKHESLKSQFKFEYKS